jgi:hypothetical protein
VPISKQPEYGGPRLAREVAAIVEASDIPILSATERLQRSLLRWVDFCGISGRYEFPGDVQDTMSGLGMLDDQAYIVGIVGANPADWPVIWAGDGVELCSGQEFGPAFTETVKEPRLLNLLVHEYADAVRYRRAAARRYSVRGLENVRGVDQLIFPLRAQSAFDYVLVHGETVAGDLLYSVDRAC